MSQHQQLQAVDKKKQSGCFSEDELGEKVDRCVADTLLKTIGGFSIGVVASVALFKRRASPIWLATGIGLGMGVANCRHDLREPYVLHGRKVRVGEDTQGKPAYQIVVSQGAGHDGGKQHSSCC